MTIENNTIRIIVSEFQDIRDITFTDEFDSPVEEFLKEGFILLVDFKLEVGFNQHGIELITS